MIKYRREINDVLRLSVKIDKKVKKSTANALSNQGKASTT